ncbi:hypothetical protein OESDEN_12787 [Oesophagostomum dentatum]|uniref:DUF5641 domain-containing protein n=1 Tax=Oesophagostomum dentatum TaxID=61180 RepID=A0A0B1SU68_OESDE|nr:hypothetical protein OESDEN_12787 [Oesophagostomum dentatum]
MAPLPRERVTQVPPFGYTGVDYMGPILIRSLTGEGEDEKRYKGQKATNQDPKVGDVVLLDEDSQLSREQWPMAIITELISSKDEKIRSAILRSSSGREIQRPLNRIVSLEIRSSVDEEEQSTKITSNSKRGLVSKVRRALKKKPLDNAETRKQPARVAKKSADYATSNPTVQGCYNCISGAKLTFSCHSKHPTMMELRCAQNQFAASCDETTVQNIAILQATVARFIDHCFDEVRKKPPQLQHF